MTNTAIARLALEGGLAGGTITGASYAVKYSNELASDPEKAEFYKSNWKK